MRLTPRRARPRHHRRLEEGSALALVPAGFLVLIVLGAIAVDSAVGFLGQRQLGDALAAAANDAAGAAVANSTFYRGGAVALDPTAAASDVCASLAAQHPNLGHLQVSMAIAGPTIALRGTADVHQIFGGALPGVRTRQVSASASAEAETAASGSVPAPTVFIHIAC